MKGYYGKVNGERHSNHAFYGPGYPIAHPGVFPHNPDAADWDIEDWLKFNYRDRWGTDAFEDTVADIADAFDTLDGELTALGGHSEALAALDALETTLSRGPLGFTTERARTRLLDRLEPLDGAVTPEEGAEAAANLVAALEALPAGVANDHVALLNGLVVKLRSSMPAMEPGFQTAYKALKAKLQVDFPYVWSDPSDREAAWAVVATNLGRLEEKRDLRREVMENGSTIDGPYFDDGALAPLAATAAILLGSHTVWAAGQGHGQHTPEMSPDATVTDYNSGLFRDGPQPDADKPSYDVDAQYDIYGRKRPVETPRPLIELGRPIYKEGPLTPHSYVLGDKNPVALGFSVYGDLRTAVSFADNGDQEVGELATRLNLDVDLKLTGTERLHAFFRPLDFDGQSTGTQFFGHDGSTGGEEQRHSVWLGAARHRRRQPAARPLMFPDKNETRRHRIADPDYPGDQSVLTPNLST